MKALALALLVICAISVPAAFGQGFVAPERDEKAGQSMDPQLAALYDTVAFGQAMPETSLHLSQDGQMVWVILEMAYTGAPIPPNLGIEAVNSYEFMIQAHVPIANLEAIAANPNVDYIRPLVEPASLAVESDMEYETGVPEQQDLQSMIAELRSMINTINSRLASLESSVSSLAARITALESGGGTPPPPPPPTTGVQGKVYRDLNNNLVLDAGEPGVPGRTVITVNTSDFTDVTRTITDANGNYSRELAAGGYLVQIEGGGPNGFKYITIQQGTMYMLNLIP